MYIDSDIFFALIKLNDRHAEFAKTVFSRNDKKYTSVLTLVELEIIVKREIDNHLSKNIFERFKELFPDVEIKNLDEKTFSKSLELRKKYSLGVFDSIHAAVALKYDKRIASTDQSYVKIKELKIIK